MAQYQPCYPCLAALFSRIFCDARFFLTKKVKLRGEAAHTLHRKQVQANLINVILPGRSGHQRERMIYLTRRCEFSASHHYSNPEMSDEENRRVFGKCNNPNGHGHNYTLEVTVKGTIDPRTGFIMDIKHLKQMLNSEVIEAMDHRYLNKEVAEFTKLIPTTENIAIVIWNRLAPRLNIAKLHRVRVYETHDLFADYYGE